MRVAGAGLAIVLLATLAACDGVPGFRGQNAAENKTDQLAVEENNWPRHQATLPTTNINGSSAAKLGRCYMDECSWSITRDQRTVKEASRGKLVQLTLLGGSSPYTPDRSNVENRQRIVWNHKAHQVYVFCSKRLPAVLQKVNSGWQVDILDFAGGVPGIYESAASIYTDVCHNGSKEALSSYKLAPLELATDPISAPTDLFELVADKPTKLPATFVGVYGSSEEACTEEFGISRLTVTPNKLSWYESDSTITRVRGTGDDLVVSVVTEGEGERYTENIAISIKGGSLQVGDNRYVRCQMPRN